MKVFADLFDPVIDERHGGYPKSAIHPTDLDYTKVLTDVSPILFIIYYYIYRSMVVYLMKSTSSPLVFVLVAVLEG